MTILSRLNDRKCILAGLVAFWTLLFATKAGRLFQSTGLSILCIIIVICSFLAALFLKGMTEKDFLILALVIGIFFVAIAPFPCLIDEDYHFSRAYSLSQGKPFPVEENGVLGMRVPEGYDHYSVSGKWNLWNIWSEGSVWLSPVKGNVFIERTRSASYLPTGYIFSAIGIGIATLLKLPFVLLILLGRLFNYAAYVLIAYFAIKKATYYKSVFFLVATIPCALYGASTISIDASLIAFSLLFISIVLKYSLERQSRITTSDTVLLALSAFFVLSAKYMGYLLIIPFFFFVGKNRPTGYRKTLITIICVSALTLIWHIIMILRYSGSIDTGAALANVSLSGQIQWIMENKSQFISIVGHDFVKNLPQRLYACSYTEEPAFSFISLPLHFLPFIAAARAKDKFPMELKQSRSYLAYWLIASAIMMIICNISIYLAWNAIGSGEILGIHERYTMPYMVFILLAFTEIQTVNTMKNRDRTVGMLSGLAILNMLMGTMLYYL